MSFDLTKGIVRILKPDGTTAGTGFVVSAEGLIATCAHVVELAGSYPGGAVRLVLHATGEEREALVSPEWWRPASAEDVAVLRLNGNLPKRVQPLPMTRSRRSKGHAFEAFGFPLASTKEGIWGPGQIVGETTKGGQRILQLESRVITIGFSGTPVHDLELEGVVGMVSIIAAPDTYYRLAETALATPVEVLVGICPNLRLVKRPKRTSRIRPIDVLRQVTKLYVGDLAQTLTGEPQKELRQFCLTQASKLPHAPYLDMQYLEGHADELKKLYRTIRVLLENYRDRPDSTRLAVLQDEARILGTHLRHIYRMNSGGAFDLGFSVAQRPEE